MRCVANVKLYTSYLDEIYLSASAALCLVSIFVVFPLVGCLQETQWLVLGWDRLLYCSHVLMSPTLFYVFVAVTCLLPLLTERCSFGQHASSNSSLGTLLSSVVVTGECASTVLVLFGAFIAVDAFPLAIISLSLAFRAIAARCSVRRSPAAARSSHSCRADSRPPRASASGCRSTVSSRR